MCVYINIPVEAEDEERIAFEGRGCELRVAKMKIAFQVLHVVSMYVCMY